MHLAHGAAAPCDVYTPTVVGHAAEEVADVQALARISRRLQAAENEIRHMQEKSRQTGARGSKMLSVLLNNSVEKEKENGDCLQPDAPIPSVVESCTGAVCLEFLEKCELHPRQGVEDPGITCTQDGVVDRRNRKLEGVSPSPVPCARNHGANVDRAQAIARRIVQQEAQTWLQWKRTQLATWFGTEVAVLDTRIAPVPRLRLQMTRADEQNVDTALVVGKEQDILSALMVATSSIYKLRLRHRVLLTWAVQARAHAIWRRRVASALTRWCMWTQLTRNARRADVQVRCRQLWRVLSAWASRLVANGVYDAACVLDSTRLLLLSMRCWARALALRCDVSYVATSAACCRIRSHFDGWKARVVESDICEAHQRHGLLRRTLSKLALHSACSLACRELRQRQRRQALKDCLFLWAHTIWQQHQVAQDVNAAKTLCLQELVIAHKLQEVAQRNCDLANQHAAFRQWHWCTEVLKEDAAQDFLRHSKTAMALCGWVMARVMLVPNHGKMPVTEMPLAAALDASTLGHAVSANMSDETFDTCNSTLFPCVRRQLLRSGVLRRLPDPARCVPRPPLIPSVGPRAQAGISVWQELLWELRMASTKLPPCVLGGSTSERQLMRPVPVGSKRALLARAQVLRARISLAAIDVLSELSEDENVYRKRP